MPALPGSCLPLRACWQALPLVSGIRRARASGHAYTGLVLTRAGAALAGCA